MPKQANYDLNASEMGGFECSEVHRIYEKSCNYPNRIIEKYSDRLITIPFTLNTGGLAILIGYLGATNKVSVNYATISGIIFFLAGIFTNVAVTYLEKNRFIKKAQIIEKLYDRFQNNEITGEKFFEYKQSKSKIKYADFWVGKIEFLSYLAFLIGVVMSAISVFK